MTSEIEQYPPRSSRNARTGPALVCAVGLVTCFAGQAQAAVTCTDTITAKVVVLDNPTVFNRLGAQNPNWITYALKRDVIAVDPITRLPTGAVPGTGLTAGNVELRPDKRPRPLVLRSRAGACLEVEFTNLLATGANPNNAQQGEDPGAVPPFPGLINNDQVWGRCAGLHASGTELVSSINDDGSMVGTNPGANLNPRLCGGGLVPPNGTITYKLHTPHEGAFVINSYGATLGSEQNSGNLGIGMFGQLNVQPKDAKFYRSQVTEEELRLATVGKTPLGQPIIRYNRRYPNIEPWISEGKANLPILNMLCTAPAANAGACVRDELVHSDINAIIAGPNPDGSFPTSTYPLESVGKSNPALPNRLEPFREFTSTFHDEQTNSQVFPKWYGNPVLGYTLAGVKDQFMINYASGGIGSEIIANRLHTGPMHDCTDCAYEEFFLASQTVGDPGLLVNFPANTGIEQCDPANILDATCWRQFGDDPDNPVNGGNPIGANPPIPGNFALFQEDPYNVHHAYTGDFVKIRNTHAGAFEQHIFHLHNHQWLFNPNDDNANYLDAQEIMPGSGHTYELANGGAGNRNKTTGDAIFHCHFYPHFAQGMWYHIRNLDTLQTGSLLAVSAGPEQALDLDGDAVADTGDLDGDGYHDTPFALRIGKPAAGARALPDGELPDGVPIPAVVPLPGKAMPLLPAKVEVVAVDRGDFGVLSGRRPPNGLGQGPDSSQAVVKRFCGATEPNCTDAAYGPDGVVGTADDVNPGFPFWLAGNECGAPRPASVHPGPDGIPGNADDIDVPADDCPSGTVGQRQPTPPLDMLTEAGATANGISPAQAGGWDGGLPRHNLRGYTAGGLSLDTQNRLDFRKVIEIAQPVYFPEVGTDLEQVAMGYHAVRNRASYANDLRGAGTTPGSFVLNGAPAVPGGPYQDPCIDDRGTPLTAGVNGWYFDGDGDPATLKTRGSSPFHSENPRTYKIANVQIDAVFNKAGYHYPQERIIALWEDVLPTINKQRPPEPLVMRFNTFDCGKILHTNLVPGEFELDDFQVRTPTDIIGQHIHLPKWDLTTGDGASNGWNYEDGTLAPAIVEERIHAINNYNALAGTRTRLLPILRDLGILPGINLNLRDALRRHVVDLRDLAPVPTIDTGDPGSSVSPGELALHAQPHPFFGAGVGDEYLGARTTIQRILMDPVVNVSGVDRGLGLTFSHDHYGPSSFQQIGLYSTILAEPAGSTWVHNESGQPLGTRPDGGPTSWQAAILPPTTPVGNVKSHLLRDHREFYFEMSDFQHAYEAGVYVGADRNGRPKHTAINQPDPFDATNANAPALAETWKHTVNPPLKLKSAAPFPDVVTAEGGCPGPAGNFDPSIPRPCAESINISHSSMFVVNYRNEPVGLRVFDPNATGPDGKPGAQTAGLAGDLAFAFQSRTDRAIPQFNSRFGRTPRGWRNAPYCNTDDEDTDLELEEDDTVRITGDLINCDRRRGDPFTPIMRAYERDEVKVKIQVGATEEQHQTTIHGLKWLSNGSGFGRSPNSGWRNFQSHGISEQFSLQTPLNPDPGQRGDTVDYLYATDATRDGMWLGSWGVLRTYGYVRPDLFQLPDNPQRGKGSKVIVVNEAEFNGVCPVSAPVTRYKVAAVLANDVLPNRLNVIIPTNAGGDSDGDGVGDNAGGLLDPAGGTLVYNRRTTNVPDVVIPAEGGEPATTLTGGQGPLNDPTAMLYVRLDDLVPDPQTPAETAACDPAQPGGGVKNPACPVRLHNNAPVEPLVLRANAGDCIKVTLFNRLPETAPDLAGWQDMMWVVNRDQFNAVRPPEMHFFNNNLIRPSSYVGLHPQLVEYDASKHDGVLVGKNRPAAAGPVEPGGKKTYTWYAGALIERDIEEDVNAPPRQDWVELRAIPVEFGGTNLLSTDRIKQPQKGLFGALVIEPKGATWPDNRGQLDTVADGQGRNLQTRKTRAQVTVDAGPLGAAGDGGTYREALAIGHRITNLRWRDGSAIANLHQGELGREGAEDNGHAGFNYAMEPAWFRYRLPPDVPFGNAGTPHSYGSIRRVHAFYANDLVAGQGNAIPLNPGVSAAGDPATPVFKATAGQASRMHVLNGASADRDGTFILHGHVWARDPYVCKNQSNLGLVGRCHPNNGVPSRSLGLNLQAKYMGGEEGMGHVYGHWPILFDAGGTGAVPGDYLFRDYTPSGNRNGQFGILRVE